MVSVPPAMTSLILDISLTDNTGKVIVITNPTASGVTWDYKFQTQSTWTAVTIVQGTQGTFSSGSIVSAGTTSALSGEHELSIPNAAVPQAFNQAVKHIIQNGTASGQTMQQYAFTLLGSELNTSGQTTVTPATFPTNFSALNITTAGQILLNPTQPGVTFASLITSAGSLTLNQAALGNVTMSSLINSGSSSFAGFVSLGSSLTITGAATFASTFSISGATTLASLTASGTVTLGTLVVSSGTLNLSSSAFGALSMTSLTNSGTANFAGTVTFAAVTTTGTVTFNAFTVSGAFSINGTSDVAQTGDSFARIGALGVGLTAVPAYGDFTSTQKTSLTNTAVASVTGAVGSVTGNVGGNVVGSVGSVIATVSANLVQILGTALTETAGYLAAAFKKWFNVATPTGTVNSIPDAVAGTSGGLFIAGNNAATVVSTLTVSNNFTITGNFNISGALGLNANYMNVGTLGITAGSATIGLTGNITGNLSGGIGGTGSWSALSGTILGTDTNQTNTVLAAAIADAEGDIDLVLSATLSTAAIDTELSGVHGAGAWGSSAGGAGQYAFSVTVNDGTNLLQNVKVTLTQGINRYTGNTSTTGTASSFNLDALVYSLVLTKDGYSYPGSTVTAAQIASGAITVSMSATIITIPVPAGFIAAILTCDEQVAGIPHTFRITAAPVGETGITYDYNPHTVLSGAGGVVEYACPYNCAMELIRGTGRRVPFIVPASGTSFSPPDAIG